MASPPGNPSAAADVAVGLRNRLRLRRLRIDDSCQGCGVAPTQPAPSGPIASGAAPFRLHVPILEYHRVKPWQGETGSARNLITPPEDFQAQMDAMAAAGWKTITMGELGDDLRLSIAPGPKTFVVTFDDGYEDGYRNAFPALLSHGFRATFFVIASRIGSQGFLSAFEMRQLVAAGNEIGNHSYSHKVLTAVAPDLLPQEINGASALIADATGVWPKSFSYPKGLGSDFLQARLAACPQLETAVVQGGSAPEIWLNHWRLPRIRVGAGTYPSDLVERATRY